MNDGLPFSVMAEDLDAQAVRACLASGMIVIVEVNNIFKITGIVSAHTDVTESFDAYNESGRNTNNSYAIIVPTAFHPIMFYNWLFLEELKDAARK